MNSILQVRDSATGEWINIPAIVGPQGDPGKSAYQYAQDGGYTGTEAEFAEKLAADLSTGGSDYQWEKIFGLTAEEKVGAVTIPVTGNEYRCLHLRVSAQIWDVSADAVHSANSGVDCEVHGNEGMINKIPFGISGDSTPMEALFINAGDRFAPFVFATNGNKFLNGPLLVHNPYYSPFQITESISVKTWSSDHYLFVEGATFELWGVRV